MSEEHLGARARAICGLVLAACGGGSCSGSGTSATGPTTAAPSYESLYAEYISTHHSSYDPPELAGKVTCFGGKAGRVDGGTKESPVEIFLRQAVDPATGIYTEDSITLTSEGATRYLTTLVPSPPTAGAEDTDVFGAVSEVNGHYAGFGGRAPGADFVTYAVDLDNRSARYGTFLTRSAEGLEYALVGDAPATAATFGLTIPTSYEATIAVVRAVRLHLAKAAPPTFAIAVGGVLPELSLDRCDDVFAHFEPPKRIR